MSTLSTSIPCGEDHSTPLRPQSPVVRLLRITDQGLVFESRRRFEVGTFIDLGMHVPGRKMRGHKASFLSVEGFLVDCQPLPVADGRAGGAETSYRVTVLFSDLDAEDRNLLRELGEGIEKTPAAPMSRRDMMLQRLEEVFGLN